MVPSKRVVFDGVILDMDGEPLVVGIEARAARDRPALHDAVEFEPQVVVQPGRVMLLDDIAVAARARLAAARLGGNIELALFAVSFEPHGATRSLDAG